MYRSESQVLGLQCGASELMRMYCINPYKKVYHKQLGIKTNLVLMPSLEDLILQAEIGNFFRTVTGGTGGDATDKYWH